MSKKNNLSEPLPLCCETIGEQDRGIAKHIIDAEIQRALDDLMDRGEEDGKSRKVVIELEMGLHNGLIFTNVAAQAKLPARRSKNTSGDVRMKAKGQHVILFQPDNPERVDQPTFDHPDDE